MFIGLVLVAALASVVESPSPDALARPKVESHGAFVCRGDELSLTATRPGCPFNLLWPQNLASGAVYRVSYEMKADVADGFGGLVLRRRRSEGPGGVWKSL